MDAIRNAQSIDRLQFIGEWVIKHDTAQNEDWTKDELFIDCLRKAYRLRGRELIEEGMPANAELAQCIDNPACY